MKVRQLIEWLSGEDPDREVHFAYNYGDAWRTTVAPEVLRVEEAYVTYSEYHSMPRIFEEPVALSGESMRLVVVLHGAGTL